MPELEIYTVGGGYFLFDVFNYLAAFTSSANFNALLYAGIVAGILVGAFQMALYGAARQVLIYFVGALIAVTIGIGPKARVILMDSTVPTGIYGTIDNVPWSVAWVGSISSRTGHTLTRVMETLLASPTDLAYQRSGMMFGSTILSQATRWRAVTPLIHQTLVNFMENCMVDGSNIGLVDTGAMGRSGDISGFIGANVPQSLAYYDPVLQATTTCATGWPQIRTRLNAEIQNILFQKAAAQVARQPGGNINAAAGKLRRTLGEFQDMIGMTSNTAARSIRQSMLIIAMDDSVQRLIASSGNNAAMTAYQAARTEAQTSASYNSVGISALKWVPLLKIVFEGLYYAAFPLAMLMMMTPLVWTVFKGYFGGFIWLASWDPLSAILHSFLMKASAGYYREAMGSFNEGALSYTLSFANHLGVRAVEQDVGSVAGYLMMSVPFISTVILFGATRMAGLATSMLNVSQGASIESGREAATGNISLANVSMNNMAANKWNTSTVRDTGASTYRMGSGAMHTTNADGTATMATGTAQSSGGMSARVGQTIREEVSDRKDAAIRTSQSARQEWTSSVSQLASNYADFGRSLSSGTSASHDRSTTSGLRGTKEAREAHRAVEDFAKEHGISVDAAYKVGLAANLGGKPLGGNAGADLTGLDRDSYRRISSAARESGLSDTVSRYGEAVQAARTSEQSSQGTSENSGEKWSLDEVRRKGDNFAAAREEAETLAAADARLQSKGISYDGRLTDAIMAEWRAAGFSEEQIAGLLNPKTVAGVKAQERAVERVLPNLLSELGVDRPNPGLASAFTLRPPAQPITQQPLPSSGQGHQATYGKYNRAYDKSSAALTGQVQAGQAAVTAKAAATQQEVVDGQDLGAVPGMGKKVLTSGGDLVDSLKDVAGSITGNPSLSNYERDVMIRTIYGEAANQGDVGQAAVAHVIMNRVADPRWGDDPAEVSMQLKQFSAWNSGVGGNALPTALREGSAEYEQIGRIVDAVAAGEITDPTGGATHYYSPAGMRAHVNAGQQSNTTPTWLGQQTQQRGGQNIRIGGHIFTGLRRDG